MECSVILCSKLDPSGWCPGLRLCPRIALENLCCRNQLDQFGADPQGQIRIVFEVSSTPIVMGKA